MSHMRAVPAIQASVRPTIPPPGEVLAAAVLALIVSLGFSVPWLLLAAPVVVTQP